MANIAIYSKILVFDKIVPNFANNMGWGVGIFYPCLPHVLGAIFLRIIGNFGFPYVMAIKLVKSLIVLLSGINMYFLAKKLYNSKNKAMFSALFYLSSSYFLVDFYMRDALNESMVFVFLPLVFLGLLYLFNDNNQKIFSFLFIIGYVGMIYSHMLLTLWLTIFLLFFLLLYVDKVFKKDYFIPLLVSTIIVIIFTSTFTVPLVEHMILGKWYIPAYDNIWVLPFKGFFVPDYYSTGNNLLFIRLSVFMIIFSVIGIYNLLFDKKFKYDKRFLFGVLLIGIMSMVLTSSKCFWENVPSFFKSIQFSWRIVTFTVFCFSLFSVTALDNVYNLFKNKYKYVMTIFLLIIVGVFTFNNMVKVKFVKNGNFNVENSFALDYFPNNSMDDRDYIYSKNSNEIEIFDGSGDAKIVKNRTPYLKFELSNIDGFVSLELPRFYYLGYEIVNSDGKKFKYVENNHGLIKVTLSKNGVYELKYTGTFAYKIAVILKSFLITVLLIFFVISVFKKIKRKNGK